MDHRSCDFVQQTYTENEARACIRTLVEAIRYCHDHGVVHRDLKVCFTHRAERLDSRHAVQPENILLVDETDEAPIKIADFGFAKVGDTQSVNCFRTACGSPG